MPPAQSTIDVNSSFSRNGDPWLEHFAKQLPTAELKEGVLNLGDGGIHFLGCDLKNSRIWIRPCYEHLTDLIREKIGDGSKSRFIIIGSPGVGKTTYSYLWLYDLAVESQIVVYQFNSNTRYLFDWSVAPHIKPAVRAGTGEDFNFELMQARTWYLVDGRANIAGEPMRFNAKCIVFTCSPNPQEYHQFAKPRDAIKLYMPVWSESEVLTCRKKLYRDRPEKEILGRYETYGGLARYVFDKSYVECIVDFKQAIDSCARFEHVFEAVGGSVHPLLYLLLHFFNVKDDNFQYYGFRVEFGSKFLATEVLANLMPFNEPHILKWVEASANDMFAGVRRQIRHYLKEQPQGRVESAQDINLGGSSSSPVSAASMPKRSYRESRDLERAAREREKLERELKIEKEKERFAQERSSRESRAERKSIESLSERDNRGLGEVSERNQRESERKRSDKEERLDRDKLELRSKLTRERDRLTREIEGLEKRRNL